MYLIIILIEYIKLINSLTVSERILGGKIVKTYPFMVSLNADNKSYCGGTLIASNLILTAAHCGNPSKKEYVLINYLSVKTEQHHKETQSPGHKGQKILIKSAYFHPQWDKKNVKNDIAIYELVHPVKNYKKVIQLETSHHSFVTKAKAIGYGYLDDDVYDPDGRLREVDLNVFSKLFCKKNMGWHTPFDTDSRICAGDLSGKHDTCTGDSGGPLFYKKNGDQLFTQIGLVSYGSDCGQKGKAAAYTRVSYYQNFINSIISKHGKH